ncbi:Transcriptional regulator containing PAS, AAA-type ATPase, and DNA-binding Fis domains [Bacillus sp. OV166]|uniref:sigma-54 interaction domain-containing protein n=1 Tax=Bacillus sp. OV166 TaxID=1882763 RepID=UPI000A2ABE03|nr:sigma 54-interacting transcriptional regulator [Bacillus sp. OV166]SMQ81500.1 Transcriptional regulator containing PAS, AAA-type ATPase, and DNA-binding Fis domains [Bacillus sp. OV166]
MFAEVNIQEISSTITKLFQSFPVRVEVVLQDDDQKSLPLKCPIISKIKKTGIDVFIRNKAKHSTCELCSLKNDCVAETTIIKPITKNKKVIGVLLVTPLDGQAGWLNKNFDNIEIQLDFCCEWISNKIENDDLKKENTLVLEEMIGLFSFIQEPILIVGLDGTIHSLSNNVSKEFNKSKTVLLGENINEIMSASDWLKIKNVKNQQDFKISIPSLKSEQAEHIAKVKPLLANGEIVSFLIKLTSIYDSKKKMTEQRVLYTFKDVKGTSDSIQTVVDIARRVAPSDTSILLRGESGTGKEVFAQAIHQASNRRDGSFIALNCAAIPESLLESELFGHVKGAFTGSSGDKPGRFEMANGGTIFLDEIGDLSLHLQAKLLRVVQERKIERVGDTKSTPVDVRIITATHRNLEELVAKGEFREDLYYRLNVIPITIPPLRERREDIPLLVEHFLKKFSRELFRSLKRLSNDVYEILLSYQWPGNIRELQNVVHHFVQLEIGDLVTMESLPKYLRDLYVNGTKIEQVDSLAVSGKRNTHVEEKDLIIELLNQYGRDTPSKKKVAKHMNISLPTLYRRISKFNIK